MNGDWISEIAQDLKKRLPVPEQEFVSALLGIVSRHGKLADNDGKGIWVGYVSGDDNDNAGIGVKCSNCAFYQTENICSIVAREIEPEGYCRLAAIPDGIVRLRDMMS